MIEALVSLVITAALAAEPEITVRPLEDEGFQGRLAGLTATEIIVDAEGSSRRLPTAKLMWVELPGAANAAKPTTWIELVDGSRLLAISFSTMGGKARIELCAGPTIEMPARSIRTVRFRQQTPELATQWRELISSMATGDVVIIRKSSTRSVEQGDKEPMTVTEQSLDQLEGTLHDVGLQSAEFEVDGDKIPVPRQKLEGLVFFQPTKRDFPQPVARLIDSAGSSWSLRDVRLAGGKLSVTTVGGLEAALPLSSVSKIDFSVGNVLFLADLEPDSGAGETAVSLQPPGMSHRFGRVFQVRNRPPLGAESFRIGGQRFDNGLSMHSPTKLVYRVPDGFRRMRATAGVDDSVVAPGRFDFVILGDGKELARHSFAGGERRQAVPIDLELQGVRRVTIVLEPADGLDFGDQLDLCEARFTK